MGDNGVFQVGFDTRTVAASRSALDEIHRREGCEVVEIEGEEIAGTCVGCGGLVLEGEPHYFYPEEDQERVCLECLKEDDGFIFGVGRLDEEERRGLGWILDTLGEEVCVLKVVKPWPWEAAVKFVEDDRAKRVVLGATEPGGIGVFAIPNNLSGIDPPGPVAGSEQLVFPLEKKAGVRSFGSWRLNATRDKAEFVPVDGADVVDPADEGVILGMDLASGIDFVDARCVPGTKCGSCEEAIRCPFLAQEAAAARSHLVDVCKSSLKGALRGELDDAAAEAPSKAELRGRDSI